MANTAKLLTQPTLVGMMRETPNYKLFNNGLTDSIMLMGHADAQKMYEPYQVVNMREAINFLNADSLSPLVRSLLECYNMGCKDIWLYPVAPMDEYVDLVSDRFTAGFKPALGGQTFYQKYYDRLTSAYATILDWDTFEIVVPVEAVYYDAGGVDFATQLIDFCSNNWATTGAVSLGVLGTRVNGTPMQEAIDTMANDSRLASFGEAGKCVMVVVGEAILNHPQLTITYNASLAVQVAANLATIDLTRSISGLKLYGAMALVGADYTSAQLETLTQAKLNPAVRTKRGKRGTSFEIMLLTDNTLGIDGTDYWAMSQMHVIANTINKVRSIGYAYIGETDPEQFKEAIWDHLNKLRQNSYIRDFSLNIQFTDRNSKAEVSIAIVPIFGIRTIYFTCEVGPGA
jgi:hypothetical protein